MSWRTLRIMQASIATSFARFCSPVLKLVVSLPPPPLLLLPSTCIPSALHWLPGKKLMVMFLLAMLLRASGLYELPAGKAPRSWSRLAAVESLHSKHCRSPMHPCRRTHHMDTGLEAPGHRSLWRKQSWAQGRCIEHVHGVAHA